MWRGEGGGAWLGWGALVCVLGAGLLGLRLYLTTLAFLLAFVLGAILVLYFTYDKSSVFSFDLDYVDNPLEQANFSIHLPKVLDLFENNAPPAKYDQRITGSETVDSFLNEIVSIIIADYVSPWYEFLTDDEEFSKYSIRQTVQGAGVNLANRVKSVDWVQLLATRFPEEITTHLKLFKQARVRMKHVNMVASKETNGNQTKASPKKNDPKQTHKRNKSETDAGWLTDGLNETQRFGKSKFYSSSENLNGKTLKDIFFDLECLMEERQFCRDIYCMDEDKEYALLCELSEAIIYLIAPEEAWQCTAMKLILVDLLAGVILRPILNLLSDPDNINRLIIRTCCKDIGLSSELFLTVIRCCDDAEELDATLELVQKEVQKLHSRDSGGECELPVRQQLSSLQYLTRVINARRASLGPQEGLNANASSSTDKIDTDIKNSLQFLRASTAWRSNAQYLLEIETQEAESPQNSKMVIENLRSSALELCDAYLAPNKPTMLGLPDNTYTNMVKKITTEDEEFDNNPTACFDDLHKCIFDALEEVPVWQTGLMADLDEEPIIGDAGESSEKIREETTKSDKLDRQKYSARCKKLMKNCLNHLPSLFHRNKLKNIDFPDKWSTFPRCASKALSACNKSHTLPKCTPPADNLPALGLTSRHSRSRSDIVGSSAQKNIDAPGGTNLSASGNVSLSHSDIDKSSRNTGTSYLQASIIETALVQDKGKTFGIYAISVTRLSDNVVWHIYRRYSDFYDLHSAIKDKWPELSALQFPGKKTFQNTSRTVLERRKNMLNAYLQDLGNLAREARYAGMMGDTLLGGFLSAQNQSEKQNNTIDALLVNSLRAGMRTLKSMPDQLANTVDGVMDGISKVFQGKSGADTLYPDGIKFSSGSDSQDDGDESVALRLLEEVLGLRGLWLRRRLLAPLRTILADRINKKVLEYVSTLTSPRNLVQYLKFLKQWLTSKGASEFGSRDAATKARTRVAAKVAFLSVSSDELRHIVGTDTARRGVLTVFELLQTQDINKRLIYVLLEATVSNLFPDNNMSELFRRLYSSSARVHTTKRQHNL